MESAYSAWPHCPGATPASCSRSSLLTPPRLSLPLKSRAIPLLIQHDPPLLRCDHKTPLCLARPLRGPAEVIMQQLQVLIRHVSVLELQSHPLGALPCHVREG